jgi:hypothetical protein
MRAVPYFTISFSQDEGSMRSGPFQQLAVIGITSVLEWILFLGIELFLTFKLCSMAMVQELEDLMDSFLKLRDLKRNVKLDLRINCKMGLLLAMAVEQSLAWADPGNLVKRIISEEDRARLQELATEILQKSEAEEFYELVKKMAKR